MIKPKARPAKPLTTDQIENLVERALVSYKHSVDARILLLESRISETTVVVKAAIKSLNEEFREIDRVVTRLQMRKKKKKS
jgi:hypothetical protein